MKLYIVTITIFLAFRPLLYCQSEIDLEMANLRLKYGSPEDESVYRVLERALLRANPRIIELQRRIEAKSDSFGALNSYIELLYSQIDSLIKEKHRIPNNGIVAARIIWYERKNATKIIYWKRKENRSEMSKAIWNRKSPTNSIDLSSPLPDWEFVQDPQSVLPQECEMFERFFGDPMPPTVIPNVVRQNETSSVILEMVSNTQDGMKYRWAIRSAMYTAEFNDFLKVWENIAK